MTDLKDVLQDFINDTLTLIAKRLPQSVKFPDGFDCGFDTGYKMALIDIQNILEIGELYD